MEGTRQRFPEVATRTDGEVDNEKVRWRHEKTQAIRERGLGRWD